MHLQALTEVRSRRKVQHTTQAEMVETGPRTAGSSVLLAPDRCESYTKCGLPAEHITLLPSSIEAWKHLVKLPGLQELWTALQSRLQQAGTAACAVTLVAAAALSSPVSAAEPFLSSTGQQRVAAGHHPVKPGLCMTGHLSLYSGARGPLADEEAKLFNLRREAESEVRQELQRARTELEVCPPSAWPSSLDRGWHACNPRSAVQVCRPSAAASSALQDSGLHVHIGSMLAAARPAMQGLLELISASGAQEQGRLSQNGKLCATPFGVDVVGITELLGLTGALVGGAHSASAPAAVTADGAAAAGVHCRLVIPT